MNQNPDEPISPPLIRPPHIGGDLLYFTGEVRHQAPNRYSVRVV